MGELEKTLTNIFTTEVRSVVYQVLLEELTTVKENGNLYSPYLNKKEACNYLKITNNTLDKWIRLGLPTITIGRTIRFDKIQIDYWLKKYCSQTSK